MSMVALIGGNSVEYINTLLDIWNAGDCAVLIDWKIPVQTSCEMMKEAGVHKCYIEKMQFKKFYDCSSYDFEYIIFEQNSICAEVIPEEIYNKYCANYTNKEAVVIYSSGTTGRAKGIVLSHFAITSNANAIVDYMKLNSDDCIYLAKPIHHSSVLTGELLVSLITRTKLIVAPTVAPPRYILNNIYIFGVTILCLNPVLLSLLTAELCRCNYEIFSLRAVYISGSILANKLYLKSIDAFRNAEIFNVYGLSEAGPRVTAQTLCCRRCNSVGKPIQGVKIAVTDENGNILSSGKRGIISVYTKSIFSRYISGEKYTPVYKNWLNTGDIGYIDDYGELYVVGRTDDIIMIGSHKIYPGDIESRIMELTGVTECIVDNVCFNENDILVCLYVGTYDITNIIRKRLKTVLLPYEIPRRFIRVKSIPYTANNKISRKRSREIIIKNLTGN